MLKKQFVSVATIAVLTTGVVFAAVQQDRVMYKRADGAYVVNTTSLRPNVKGFKGAAPVEAYIENSKVIKVRALPNRKGPKFYNRMKQEFFPVLNGMKISKTARVESLDGAAGATYTSHTVKENITATVAYYRENR